MITHHHKPTPLKLTEAQKESIRQKRRMSKDRTPEPEAPPEPRPTPVRKVKHATAAAVRVVRAAASGKKVRVSEEERDRRLAICRACPYWREGGNVGLGECIHSKCGCTRFKHGLATETCPIGKWPAKKPNM